MKDSTLMLLGGAGLLYLLTRGKSSGTAAPAASPYGTPFAQPVSGARVAGGAVASTASQVGTVASAVGSALSSIASLFGRGGGGGGSSGGGGGFGGGGGHTTQMNTSPPVDNTGTVFGEGVSGNVFDTAGGSSLSMTNQDFGSFFGDPGSGVAPVDNSSDPGNELGVPDYTGGGDFNGYDNGEG